MSRDGLSVGDYGYPLLQGTDGKPHAERPGFVTALTDATLTIESKIGAVAHYNRRAATFIGFIEQESGSSQSNGYRAEQHIPQRAG